MRKLILVICLVILTYHAIILTTVRWHADDLADAAVVQQSSVLALISTYWQSWTGRVGYALLAGILKTIPEPLAGIPLILMLALWAGACWALAQERGLVVLVATLSAAPLLEESLYWQAGALVYSLPLALFVVALVTVKRGYHASIPLLLVLFIATLSDTMQVIQIVALGTLWLLFPAYRRVFAGMLIAAVIGLVIVQLAPGNALRKAHFPPPDLGLSLSYAARATGTVLAGALRRAPLALVLVGVAGLLWGERAVTVLDKRRALIVLLGIIAVNFAGMLAFYYATSGPMNARSEIIPLFVTLAGLCYVMPILLPRRWHVAVHKVALGPT